MGFHTFANTYDWGRVAPYRKTAQAAPGGMIDLSVGSPVDATPATVRRALADSADAPDAHGYPKAEGSARLRRAIVDWFRNVRGVDCERMGADFVPTVGSKEAVALMASLLHLEPGDVVVQPRISYPTYEIGTQLAGAAVCKVANVADVDSWRSIPGVKAIWVNSPSNPTGQVLSAGQLRGIVEAARSIGAVVLSDECYALLTWSEDAEGGDGAVPASCILEPAVCGGTARGVLALYSLSKQSNMAGYRTAFIAGDPELIGPMKLYRKQIGQIIPGPVQAAMAVALEDGRSVGIQRGLYRRRFETLVNGLRAAGYDARVPQGALYVWVRAKSGDCWQDMAELARIGIVSSPGEFYGDPTRLRFSVTADGATLAEAARRLEA